MIVWSPCVRFLNVEKSSSISRVVSPLVLIVEETERVVARVCVHAMGIGYVCLGGCICLVMLLYAKTSACLRTDL